MKVILYNPEKSSVNIYWNKIGGGAQLNQNGRIYRYWGALHQYLTDRQQDVVVLGATQSPTLNQVLSTNLYVKKDPGDVLPVIPSASTVLQIPPRGGPNRNFRKRKGRGEVVMSDYRVGTVEFRRVAKVVNRPSSWPTTVAFSYGWVSATDGTPLGVLPARPTPPAGYTLAGISIVVSYSTITLPASGLVLSPDVSSMDLDSLALPKDEGLVTEVLADCNNGVYDILTEVLELPDTFRFLSEEFKKAVFMTCDLEDEARAMRKALPAEKFTKWFANHWLKGRYALMPIFYSIQDIAKVLEQIGMEYAEYKKSQNIETEFPCALPPGTICREAVGSQHRCMIKSRYTTDSLLSDFRRLINVNLAVTAWELTTYSFVVDWAFNIGDYLAALTGSDGATDSKCCYSVRLKETYLVEYDTTDPALQGVATLVKFNAYDRAIINPSAHIGLDVGIDMTWKRIIDAFALSTRPAFDRLRGLRT